MSAKDVRGRAYGQRNTRRLPDTYNFEVTRSTPRSPSVVVNLEQFEFLRDVPPDFLGPRGSGYTKAVKRGSRRYRGA